jgi:dTDP-4-dehydrorhamnose 3,5-epimerase
MRVTATPLPDLLIFEPQIHTDERGWFCESFNQATFQAVTQSSAAFVQDNHCQSVRGVLRGLHYQTAPHAQGKVVRAIAGEVWDVTVDLRVKSTTRGQWFGTLLSSSNQRQLWIPPGFAHGFLTLSESAELLYKTTHFYSPEHERCIAWDDPQLAIDWQLDRLGGASPQLSAKDKLGRAWIVST